MEKINQELKKQIMAVIQREIDDPGLDFLSIVRVETTKDLQESKVYYTLLDENSYIKAKEALEQMKGFIRSSLAKRIRLKTLPQLNFIPDESIKYSVDIYQKIEEVKEMNGKNEETITEEDS
ncbi:MAG: 30S ribosome-binding factor RbfA [Candidatus Omnitrophota bacterium]